METVTQLRRICQSEEKISSDAIYIRVVSRRLSIYLTAILLRLGFTANSTSTLGLLVGLGGVVLVGIPSNVVMSFAGVLLLQLSHLFDCSDGEIARYEKHKASTQNANLGGAYLDEMGHVILEPLTLLAFGVGAAHYFQDWDRLIYLLAFLGALGVLGGPNFAMASVLFRAIQEAPTLMENNAFREIVSGATGEHKSIQKQQHPPLKELLIAYGAELLIYPGLLVNVTIVIFIELVLCQFGYPEGAAVVRLSVFSFLSLVYILNFLRIFRRNFKHLDRTF
jgi:phosphatidylglycerophosphate synthase